MSLLASVMLALQANQCQFKTDTVASVASNPRRRGERTERMASADEGATKTAEETIERIRALNEQVLQAGRELGQGVLDAFEQSMQTFADFQQRAAEGTDVNWIAQVAKAQADFTRQVTRYSTEAARKMLK